MQIVIRSSNGLKGGSGESGEFLVCSIANQASGMGVKMATVVFATVPILVLYPFLRKYFAKGILMGS